MRKFDKATVFALFSVCASALLMLTIHTPANGRTDDPCDGAPFDQCAGLRAVGWQCYLAPGPALTKVYCADCDGDGTAHYLYATTTDYDCYQSTFYNPCKIKTVTYGGTCINGGL